MRNGPYAENLFIYFFEFLRKQSSDELHLFSLRNRTKNRVKKGKRKTVCEGAHPVKGGPLNSLVTVAVGSRRRPNLLGTVSAVLQATAGLTGGSEAAVDPVLVFVVADPVDFRIVLDNRAGRVNEDDLIPLLLSVGADPVRVQHFKVLEPFLCPLFSDPLKAFADDELFFTLSLSTATGFDLPLLECALPDLGPDEDEALFCAISEGPGPVKPGGLLDPEEVFVLSPLDFTLSVEALHVRLRRVVPGLSDVSVHALPAYIAGSLFGCCFFSHQNHLFGFALASTFPSEPWILQLLLKTGPYLNDAVPGFLSVMSDPVLYEYGVTR